MVAIVYSLVNDGEIVDSYDRLEDAEIAKDELSVIIAYEDAIGDVVHSIPNLLSDLTGEIRQKDSNESVIKAIEDILTEYREKYPRKG